MSLVVQTPFIWHASLRNNLDPHGEYSDKDIWLTLARIGMSSAVSEFPNKLETVLDDGESLSSGQRQPLCLARVLLRRRKIIVLDEASRPGAHYHYGGHSLGPCSLDADTDKKIREIIRTDFTDSTVILVAHRIEIIIDFDLILGMENGTLVETGSPAFLQQLKLGKLASARD
ncbi:P-loop containing nucleoside triphosphate hydrolase protein [Mycena latifolia]|nr:P-loop containing nucleoside triphosphate hydrolase protein [Mycena latifolia]